MVQTKILCIEILLDELKAQSGDGVHGNWTILAANF